MDRSETQRNGIHAQLSKFSDDHPEWRPGYRYLFGNDAIWEGFPLEVRTDYAGHYSLLGLDAGAHWLSAYKPGYDLAGQQLLVSASVADMPIRMMPTDGVALTVRDAVTRSPLRHVWVIERVDQSDGNMLTMTLDSLGGGRLPPALKGRTFVVSSLGYRVAPIVHWNGAALDLSLVPDGG